MVTPGVEELALDCLDNTDDFATAAGETSPAPNAGSDDAIFGTETVDGMKDGSADTLCDDEVVGLPVWWYITVGDRAVVAVSTLGSGTETEGWTM